ncbi:MULTISPECIES: hypothetical protein [unclassified Lysobacter]|uniref:hypothetical protein n=1 Tax=unclassified Lysobacter TaxID=2635362 RepID=UPI0006FD123C|nr:MULTISPECIES: hypothetical protein [unclassified Lysobacter]KRA16822.1 hypothetical protein ASD69_08695 [Lysobacter sp. Root604]KRD28576.1 hypothetical protein ASE35_20085 [Lysobacter sp. Root916]
MAPRPPLAISAITAQQKQIHDDVIAQRGRYKDMPASTRSELLSKQAEVLAMIEGKNSSGDLSQEQQVQVFNRLEWIEAAINNAEDERMVCKREKTIGSTRITRVCRTVAQEREAREAARDELDRADVQNRR